MTMFLSNLKGVLILFFGIALFAGLAFKFVDASAGLFGPLGGWSAYLLVASVVFASVLTLIGVAIDIKIERPLKEDDRNGH